MIGDGGGAMVQPPLKQMLSRDPLLQPLGEERLRSLIFQTRMTAGSIGNGGRA
jgi:hypothetical protein